MAQDNDGESLASLVGLIYEASFEPDRWRDVLPRLVTALNGDKSFAGFTSSVLGRTLTTVSHEVDEQMLREWQEDFAGFDPWNDRSGALPTGTVVHGLEVVPWEELTRAEVHAAVFRRYGFDDLICASVANHGSSFDFVTVHRSRRKGPFEEADVRTMRFLAPHLVRAAQIHDKLAFLADTQAAHEMLLARLPYGVAMLDPRGRVLQLNPEAERIFAAADGLVLRGGAIRAAHLDTDRKLTAAVSETCGTAESSSTESGALISVLRRSASRAYQVLVAPVRPRSRELVLGSVAKHIAAVLVVSDPETEPELAAASLRRLFGLTPALARLAAALAAGNSLAEYAESAQITQGTARWHLKELFARTRTTRQADLVRLLLRSVAQLQPE